MGKYMEIFTINTQFTSAMVTLELRTAKYLQCKKFTRILSVHLTSLLEM